MIDLSGTEVASYVYDSWGNIKDTKGDPTVRELNPIRYRSYVYDTETSLYYLQSRYYDPFVGRFLNADIYCDTNTGTPLSTNMFSYCENNVVMNMDNKGYSIGISSGWVSFGIDLIIDVFAAPVALAYHAIKIAVKTYLKKYGVKKSCKVYNKENNIKMQKNSY